MHYYNYTPVAIISNLQYQAIGQILSDSLVYTCFFWREGIFTHTSTTSIIFTATSIFLVWYVKLFIKIIDNSICHFIRLAKKKCLRVSFY